MSVVFTFHPLLAATLNRTLMVLLQTVGESVRKRSCLFIPSCNKPGPDVITFPPQNPCCRYSILTCIVYFLVSVKILQLLQFDLFCLHTFRFPMFASRYQHQIHCSLIHLPCSSIFKIYTALDGTLIFLDIEPISILSCFLTSTAYNVAWTHSLSGCSLYLTLSFFLKDSPIVCCPNSRSCALWLLLLTSPAFKLLTPTSSRTSLTGSLPSGSRTGTESPSSNPSTAGTSNLWETMLPNSSPLIGSQTGSEITHAKPAFNILLGDTLTNTPLCRTNTTFLSWKTTFAGPNHLFRPSRL